jgi:hypothetical protein
MESASMYVKYDDISFETIEDIHRNIDNCLSRLKQDCEVINNIFASLEKKKQDRKEKIQTDQSIITDCLIDLEDLSSNHRYSYEKSDKWYRLQFTIKGIKKSSDKLSLNKEILSAFKVLLDTKSKIERNFDYCKIKVVFGNDNVILFVRIEKVEKVQRDDDDDEEYDEFDHVDEDDWDEEDEDDGEGDWEEEDEDDYEY